MTALPSKGDILLRLGGVSSVPTADLLATGVAQPIQKLFRRDQIGGAETFRKPSVNRLKARDGVRRVALIAQQTGEARGRAQLPGQCLLLARFIERLPEEALRSFGSCGRA